jgi:hypothetical protein
VLDLVLTRGELAIDASARFHLELPTDPAFLDADLGHDRGDTLNRAERRKWVDADRRRSLSIEIIGRRDTGRDHCARPIPDPFTDGADRRVFSSHRRPGSPLARRLRPARRWQRSGVRTPISWRDLRLSTPSLRASGTAPA